MYEKAVKFIYSLTSKRINERIETLKTRNKKRIEDLKKNKIWKNMKKSEADRIKSETEFKKKHPNQQIPESLEFSKDELKLPNVVFYQGNGDVIGDIRRCECLKDNPYLIPNGAVSGLVKYGEFDNDHELHWGKEAELRDYIQELFINMIVDIVTENREEIFKLTHKRLFKKNSKESDNKQKKKGNEEFPLFYKIHTLLLEYIPYAKWSAYLNAWHDWQTSNTGTTEKIDFGRVHFLEGDLIKIDYINTLKEASVRLYKQHLNNIFLDKFREFTKITNNFGDNKGFKLLPNRLETFMIDEISPLIENLLLVKDRAGDRIHDIILEDAFPKQEFNQSLMESLEPDEIDLINKKKKQFELLKDRGRINWEYSERFEEMQLNIEGETKKIRVSVLNEYAEKGGWTLEEAEIVEAYKPNTIKADKLEYLRNRDKYPKWESLEAMPLSEE